MATFSKMELYLVSSSQEFNGEHCGVIDFYRQQDIEL